MDKFNHQWTCECSAINPVYSSTCQNCGKDAPPRKHLAVGGGPPKYPCSCGEPRGHKPTQNCVGYPQWDSFVAS